MLSQPSAADRLTGDFEGNYPLTCLECSALCRVPLRRHRPRWRKTEAAGALVAAGGAAGVRADDRIVFRYPPVEADFRRFVLGHLLDQFGLQICSSGRGWTCFWCYLIHGWPEQRLLLRPS
ncbi:hypothetical protein LshimejAT787_0204860 [Lyophyllum shimeji]|uniref:Uncharacterized protein n=1 Tax=Lyophyllum shimeji TaxID=47721 RepID=A0A9P3PG95_LYOSH|nr:hypothetical protein LshimejAT787_0204860 [Lyophyllum shimeji]